MKLTLSYSTTSKMHFIHVVTQRKNQNDTDVSCECDSHLEK